MKILWTMHNAWKDGVAACLVPDDYVLTDYDRACAVAPPKPIAPSDWTFTRGNLAELVKMYPCPAQQAIPKVKRTEG